MNFKRNTSCSKKFSNYWNFVVSRFATFYLITALLLLNSVRYSDQQSDTSQNVDNNGDFTLDDMDALLGDSGIPDDYKARQYFAPTTGSCPPNAPKCVVNLKDLGRRGGAFPSTYDWRRYGIMSPIKSQGRCSACYAFAGAGVVESVIRLKFDEDTNLSEQQAISCDSQQSGCKGGGMGIFEFWKRNPPHTERCNPFRGSDTIPCFNKCVGKPYKVSQWKTVDPADEYSIKYAIVHDGPGYLSFDVYKPFANYWRGTSGLVYDNTRNPGPMRGRHAGQLIGWDDSKEAWLLQNGWGMNPSGPMFNGSFFLPFGYFNLLRFGLAFVKMEKIRDFVAQPTGGDENCFDEHRCCTIWASQFNQCRVNPRWMINNCKVACRSCVPRFTYGSCRDYFEECPAWAHRGECRINKNWMDMNCRASCDSCALFAFTSLQSACILR